MEPDVQLQSGSSPLNIDTLQQRQRALPSAREVRFRQRELKKRPTDQMNERNGKATRSRARKHRSKSSASPSLRSTTTNSTDSTFTCDICNRHFISDFTLTTHLTTHRQNRPFICQKCGATFKSELRMKEHDLTRHKTFKPFKCSKCPKRFVRACILRKHELTHSDDAHIRRPYMCETCCKRFRRRTELQKHVDHEHLGLSSSVTDISHTNGSHGKKTVLVKSRHLKALCEAKRGGHMCTLCGLVFASDDLLMQHRSDSHKLVGPHQERIGQSFFCCDICHFKSHHISKIRRHMCVHVPNRPFCCALCDNTYKRNSHLQDHQRCKHPNVVDCKNCGRLFASEHTLRLHRKRFPFKCQKCRRCMMSQVLMNTHEHMTPAGDSTNDAAKCVEMSGYHVISAGATCEEHESTYTAMDGRHRYKSTVKYACIHCPALFGWSANLKRHSEKYHGVRHENRRRKIATKSHIKKTKKTNHVTEKRNDYLMNCKRSALFGVEDLVTSQCSDLDIVVHPKEEICIKEETLMEPN